MQDATIAPMTTVLIVDDHADFRAQARALLEAEGLQVVGEAVDGRSGLAAVRELRPDVVLLDIGLPDIDGFAVAEGLAAQDSPTHVVLVSSREARTYGDRISAAPVAGFLPKDELSATGLVALLER